MLNARAVFMHVSVVVAMAFAMNATAESGSSFRVELEGKVHDELGQPLVGAVVSVFGKNLTDGARIAVTDESGEFQLDGVPPGLYRLRAYLSGFLPSAYAQVLVEEGMERVGAILMSLAALDGSSETVADTAGGSDESDRTLAELKWILRHGDRHILKDEERVVPVAVASAPDAAPVSSAFETQFAVNGEFGVRAAAFDQGLDAFPGSGAGLDARLAYARLFIPTKDGGQWLVSAQLLESALSSWAGQAEYTTGPREGHRLSAGVTYGNYLYGDLEDFRPPEAALSFRETGTRSTEWFGSAFVSDAFVIGRTTIDAGLSYEHFGYLDKAGYVSPRVAIGYPVGSDTLVRGSVGYRVQAPGAEDIGLLSQVAYSDVYGPTEATRAPLRAEGTARLQLGIERRIGESATVAVRLFQEAATDQLFKVYTQDRRDGAGHFTVGNRGDFRTRGLGLSFSQRIGALEGSVGYTFGLGRALTTPLGVVDPSDKEIHDVTTVVATSIDKTQTRLRAAYRFILHPSLARYGDGFAPDTTVDSRFHIQVYQLLPFVGWDGTSWELMVAVRNLFYEDIENASILDEIAVVDAPRRVLGGVTVRF